MNNVLAWYMGLQSTCGSNSNSRVYGITILSVLLACHRNLLQQIDLVEKEKEWKKNALCYPLHLGRALGRRRWQ